MQSKLALPRVLFLGQVEYQDSLQWMQAFTQARDSDTQDEFWVLQHPRIFTQGTSCKAVPRGGDQTIPVLKTDRGGQISYHAPGQLIVYLLLDIKRLGLGPKRLVRNIEQGLINFLMHYKLPAHLQKGAPGVYVDQKKIAALGLRIKQGCCYHGLSLNVDLDLSAFNAIDPCGYPELEVTSLADLGLSLSIQTISNQLVDCLIDSIYSNTPLD